MGDILPAGGHLDLHEQPAVTLGTVMVSTSYTSASPTPMVFPTPLTTAEYDPGGSVIWKAGSFAQFGGGTLCPGFGWQGSCPGGGGVQG